MNTTLDEAEALYEALRKKGHTVVVNEPGTSKHTRGTRVEVKFRPHMPAQVRYELFTQEPLFTNPAT